MSGYQSKKLIAKQVAGKDFEFLGMTKREKRMLDKIWSIETKEDLKDWQIALSEEDAQLAESLITLVLLEHFDSFIEEAGDYELANEVISKFTLH